MLAPETRAKCGRLIRLLCSPEDGEALGAARGLGRVLLADGADFHVLAAEIERGPSSVVSLRPETRTHYGADWQRTARWCAQHASRLSQKDAAFVRGLIVSRWRSLSAGQEKWLADIVSRLRRAAA